MGAHLIDLTGQRFGRLTVLERGEDYVAPPNFTSGVRATVPRWLCQCDCGNRVQVATNSLRTGKTRSCGCLRKECITKTNLARCERRRERLRAQQKPPDRHSITPGG